MATVVKLEITMDEHGRVAVNGPITNKIMCYGLLMAAMDAVRAYKPGEPHLEVVGAIPGLGMPS